MWLDAFFSVSIVVVCVVGAPLAATLGVPSEARAATAGVLLGSAVLLAGLGVITATLLMMRMRSGDVLLPTALWLPLPGPLRPPEYRRRRPRR